MAATLGELAARFGCELRGDPNVVVNRVGTLSSAAPDAVTFLANSLYRAQLKDTRAAAVIVAPRDRDACPVACLVHAEPYLTYARVASALHPPANVVAGVHASAVVAPSARVAASAQIDAHAVVGNDSTIGEEAVIGPGAVVGANVKVGRGTRVGARVTLLDGVQIGARCILHPGAVIGADGFGFAPDRGTWQKIPQVGSVVVGEDGVKLDNLVQIAHNVRLGAHTVMAAMSGVAGSTKVGKRCMIGGGVVMVNQLTICDDVMFTFRSVVTQSVDEPGTYSGHLPAEEAATWRKNAARFRKLDALADRLVKAERELARLTGAKLKNNDD
jgi:UDP-3-O-[3-hydroxymyristoyl] glucosamine N-acyltransferase